jgi:hypothetical protein
MLGKSTGSKIGRELKFVTCVPSNKKRTSVIFPCPRSCPEASVRAKALLRNSINVEWSDLNSVGTKLELIIPMPSVIGKWATVHSYNTRSHYVVLRSARLSPAGNQMLAGPAYFGETHRERSRICIAVLRRCIHLGSCG